MDDDNDHSSDYKLKQLQFKEDEAETATSQMLVVEGIIDAYVEPEDKVEVKEEDEGQDKVKGEDKAQFKDKVGEENKGKEVDKIWGKEKGKQQNKVGKEDKEKRENNEKGKDKVRGKKQIHVYKSAGKASTWAGSGERERGFLILIFKKSDNHSEEDLLPWIMNIWIF